MDVGVHRNRDVRAMVGQMNEALRCGDGQDIGCIQTQKPDAWLASVLDVGANVQLGKQTMTDATAMSFAGSWQP
jgi:hypothetical protein